MNVCITPKTTIEFEKYYQLRWQVLRQPWNKTFGSEKDALEAQSYHRMIMDDNQQVLAVGRLEKISQYVGKIRYMAVSPKAQGQGLGKAIMNALEELAQTLGIIEIELNARENSVTFYQKLLYQKGLFSHLLFDDIKHFIMRKQISTHTKHQHIQAQVLKEIWHDTIPLSKAMGMDISYYDDVKLLTHCDEVFNKNIHHTMFAGSIYTLATLTGWGWLYFQLQSAALEGDIVLADAKIRYRRPIIGHAHGQVEFDNTFNELLPLKLGNKARVTLNVQVYCGDNVAANFTGTYFIMPKLIK